MRAGNSEVEVQRAPPKMGKQTAASAQLPRKTPLHSTFIMIICGEILRGSYWIRKGLKLGEKFCAKALC